MPEEDFEIEDQQEAPRMEIPQELLNPEPHKPYSELTEEEKEERRAKRLKEKEEKDKVKYKLTACLTLVRAYYAANEVRFSLLLRKKFLLLSRTSILLRPKTSCSTRSWRLE
jgi:hypothetical protein